MTPLLEQINNVLAAEIGRTMAKGTVDASLRGLGLLPGDIRPEHLDALAEALKAPLGVFLGHAKANFIAKRVKRLNELQER